MTPPLPIESPLPQTWHGLYCGIKAFMAGLRLVAPGGGLFRYAIAPGLVSLFVLAGGVLLGWWLLQGWLTAWIAQQGWGSWLGWLGSAVVFVMAVLIAYFLFMPVMALMAPIFIDPIVERVYERYTGLKIAPDDSRSFLHRQLGATLLSGKITLVSLVIELPLALFALFSGVGAVVAIPIRGWIQGGDLLDSPLGMRKWGIRRRYAFFARHKWAVAGLGICSDLAMLIPILNLLVLAAGAAGATLILIASETPAQMPISPLVPASSSDQNR